MPRPNQTPKIGARITRGIEFDRLDVGVEQRRRGRAQREPQADRQPEDRADDERERGLEQRHAEVLVDRARREPVPDAAADLERLAEEERRLVRVVEVERRQQCRAGQRRARRATPPASSTDCHRRSALLLFCRA